MKLTEKIKEIHFDKEKLDEMILIFNKGDKFICHLTDELDKAYDLIDGIKKVRQELNENLRVINEYEDYSIETVEKAIKFVEEFSIPESFLSTDQ